MDVREAFQTRSRCRLESRLGRRREGRMATSAFQAHKGLMAQQSMMTSLARSPSGGDPEKPLAAAHLSLT